MNFQNPRFSKIFLPISIAFLLFVSCIGRQQQAVAETTEPIDSLVIYTDDFLSSGLYGDHADARRATCV